MSVSERTGLIAKKDEFLLLGFRSLPVETRFIRKANGFLRVKSRALPLVCDAPPVHSPPSLELPREACITFFEVISAIHDRPEDVRGARQTFEDVALRELPVLYRMAQRFLGSGPDAEDLVSQTLLLAAKGWASFDGRFPRSWLIKIMKNEFLRLRRSSHSAPVGFGDAPEPCDEGREWRDLDTQLLSETIISELDGLPEEYRLAVSLCDVEEMSYDEAARALEVPIGTIRSRLFRGRRLLRDKLAWGQEAL